MSDCVAFSSSFLAFYQSRIDYPEGEMTSFPKPCCCPPETSSVFKDYLRAWLSFPVNKVLFLSPPTRI